MSRATAVATIAHSQHTPMPISPFGAVALDCLTAQIPSTGGGARNLLCCSLVLVAYTAVQAGDTAGSVRDKRCQHHRHKRAPGLCQLTLSEAPIRSDHHKARIGIETGHQLFA